VNTGISDCVVTPLPKFIFCLGFVACAAGILGVGAGTIGFADDCITILPEG
jgi:hypothetical protein